MASSAGQIDRQREVAIGGVAKTGSRAAVSMRPDSLTLAGMAALVVLVAANVVAIRFTNRELPPFWGAGMRFAAASAVFYLIVLIRGLPLPRGRALVGTLLFGTLQFGLGFALGYWALLKVPAGLASVILASVPLFTLLFASAARLEPLRMRGILSSLVAIAGIAVMFWERAGEEIPVGYLMAAVGTATCFAAAPVVAKSFPQVHPAAMNAVGMSAGTLILLGLSLASGEAAVLPSQPATWIAQLYLVIPGSVGVFALILFLLKRWTASGVSYQMVLSPLVTIALSAWLLDEPVTGGLSLGGALVIAGVYLGAMARGRRGT